MVSIRLAKMSDFDFFYEIKSEDNNVFWSGWEKAPDKNNLRQFFENSVKNCSEKDVRKIYIIENEEHERVGHLYIIPDGEEYDLPCSILGRYGGRGYAKQAIRLGLEEGKRFGFKKMVGSIREDNIASLKAYTSCGVEVLDEYKDVFIPGLNKYVKMNTVVYDYH